MTLSERVRAVEMLNSHASGASGLAEGLGRRANGPDSGAPTVGGPRKLSVQDLRQGVKEWISFEELARILDENPSRAKNELRSACKRVFADDAWAVLTGPERRMLTEELIDIVFGMGPIESLLEDESISEIMINGSSSVFFERDGILHESDVRFESDDQVRLLIDRILGPLGRRIDESSPMVNARLPEGHRVHAVIPPIALDGPHITIRMFTRRVITLEEMMGHGSFGNDVFEFFSWIVRTRKNICVSGGTGSGKTTMLNAMSKLISPDERILTIEDSAELKFNEHKHVVRMEARPKNSEGTGEVTIRELVINALRMRPDRIIVGECRGGEALDMLQAMNTGHDGSLTTLHANSPEDVIDRMVTLVRYAVDLPVDAIEAQIGHAFHNIIQVSRGSGGSRFVSAIADVSYDRGNRTCIVSRVYEREDVEAQGVWIRKPRIVDEILESRIQGTVGKEEVYRWQRAIFGR